MAWQNESIKVSRSSSIRSLADLLIGPRRVRAPPSTCSSLTYRAAREPVCIIESLTGKLSDYGSSLVIRDTAKICKFVATGKQLLSVQSTVCVALLNCYIIAILMVNKQHFCGRVLPLSIVRIQIREFLKLVQYLSTNIILNFKNSGKKRQPLMRQYISFYDSLPVCGNF